MITHKIRERSLNDVIISVMILGFLVKITIETMVNNQNVPERFINIFNNQKNTSQNSIPGYFKHLLMQNKS